MTKLVRTKPAEQRARIRARTESAAAPLVVVPKRSTSPAEAYLSTLLEGSSRDTMRVALYKVSRILCAPMGLVNVDIFTFPWHQIDFAIAAGLRSHLQKTCAPNSANLYIASLRGVLKACRDLRLMASDDRDSAFAGLKKIRGHREPKGRALGDEEILKLFKACDMRTGIGKRDAAMLALLFGCGLRREEAVTLELSSIQRAATKVKIVVTGKGNKERSIPLTKGALSFVDEWVIHRGDDEGPILLTCGEGRKPKPLTVDGVYSRIIVLAKAAGLEHLSPHDLRRTFITNLLSDGVDALTARGLAGHESLQTTMTYDRRGDKAKEEAMNKFHGDRFAGLWKGAQR